MNSNQRSDQPSKPSPCPRLYLLILLGPILGFIVVIWAVGFWVQPVSGDLTRISHYTDRDFGWNAQQERLLQPAKGVAPSSKADQFSAENNWPLRGDILWFGDSFSDFPVDHLSWVAMIEHQTGLSVQVVRDMPYPQVLSYLRSNSFRQSPPQLVVFQSVERYFLERMRSIASGLACAGPAQRSQSMLSSVISNPAQPLQTKTQTRSTWYSSVDAFFERSVIFLRKRLKPKVGPVLEVELTRSDLFSNSKQGSVLLYRQDVTKHEFHGVSEEQFQELTTQFACGLSVLANEVGETPFRFVFVPDKRTVYQPWIRTVLPKKPLPLAPEFKRVLGNHGIDLTQALTEAVKAGTQDVYLPNDSHWGSAGNRIAAEQVLRSIK